MPSKQVEDVYNAGGFDGGPLGRPGRKGAAQDVVSRVQQHIAKMVEDAHDAAIADAHTYGAGWLMVDQSGQVKHVTPADIRGWLDRLEG